MGVTLNKLIEERDRYNAEHYPSTYGKKKPDIYELLPKINPPTENVTIIPFYNVRSSEEIDEKKYLLFTSDLTDKGAQNINKIYSERFKDEDGKTITITHKSYYTINYRNVRMVKTEIEKRFYETKPNEYNLYKQIYRGCQIRYFWNDMERYNKKFKVDSSWWHDINRTTDIIIKAEKIDGVIKGFEMVFDKNKKTLSYRRITDKNKPYEYLENVEYIKVINIFTKLNSELTIENEEPDRDYYAERDYIEPKIIYE